MRVSLYKILFHFKALWQESIILLWPPPHCKAYPIVMLMHGHCAVYAPPPTTPFLCYIHHTILVMAISCKSQEAGGYGGMRGDAGGCGGSGGMPGHARERAGRWKGEDPPIPPLPIPLLDVHSRVVWRFGASCSVQVRVHRLTGDAARVPFPFVLYKPSVRFLFVGVLYPLY